MCKLPDGRIIKTEVVVMGEDEKPENWKLRKKDDEALTQDDQRCQPGSPLIDPPSTHLQRTGRPFPSSLQNLNPQSLSFPTSSQHSHHLLHMPFPLPSPRTSRSSGRMSVAGSPRTPPSMNGTLCGRRRMEISETVQGEMALASIYTGGVGDVRCGSAPRTSCTSVTAADGGRMEMMTSDRSTSSGRGTEEAARSSVAGERAEREGGEQGQGGLADV